MKKQIVLATIATLATSSAWATKTRMNALGQNNDRGSFYINDTRSVFRNAARINQMNNYIVTEWGDATATGGQTAPKAEGGFFKNAGALNYGVYMGSNVDDAAGNLSATATSTVNNIQGFAGSTLASKTAGANVASIFSDFKSRSNDLDLMVGGDMGVEWGARLHYAHGKDEGSITKKQDTLGLGLGMIMGDLNAYVDYMINSKATGGAAAGDSLKDDGSMDVGLGYKWMDFTFFADYTRKAYKMNISNAASKTSQNVLTVGAGYIKEVSSTSRIFSDVSYVSTNNKDTNGGTTTKKDLSAIPVTIGFETDATSWLTLRGSIQQNVFVNNVKSGSINSTKNNTTSVNAGATLNFGKLMVDGMIGTTGNSGTAGTGNQKGVLSTDRLLTQVAVHYWF